MLLQELRLAWRSARAHPGFTAVVVLTLGLGIAANAVMFGVVDKLLLSPPPHVRDAGRVTRLYFTQRYRNDPPSPSSTSNYPTYAIVRDEVPAFDHVAAYFGTELPLGEGVEVRPARVVLATASYFPVLGVRPAVGRFFTAAEDRPRDAAQVVVLSDALWRGAFGADPGVVGREVTIAGARYSVVGVAPRGFTGADISPVDAWLPLSAAAGSAFLSDWDTNDGSYWLQVIAHLRPGVTRERASQEATVAYRRSDMERKDRFSTREGAQAGPLNVARGAQPPRQRKFEVPVSLWLAGVSAVVLLVACANVASLLLARAMQRRREIAVRLALGIGRGRLVAHLLAESLILAIAGGVAGLVLAYWGGRVVRSTLLPDVAWSGSPIDVRVLAFTLGAVLLTGVLTGLLPALRASRPDLAQALKAGAREGGGHRARARNTLVVLQVALSVVLLAGAGLFVQSLRHVQRIDLGMQASRLILASGGMSAARVPARERDALLRQARERLLAHPGIEGVSLALAAPFAGARGGYLKIPGRDSLPRLVSGGPYVNAVSTDFFRTMGSTMVRGRPLTEADVGQPVLVINETLARGFWPDQDPIGTCVYTSKDVCSTIVGIARDITQWQLVGDRPFAQFYVPLPATTDPEAYLASILLIRTSGDPYPLTAEIHRELAALSPALAYLTVQPLDERIAPQLRPWRLGATMFGIFGALALLIAAVGLYSSLAYTVTQRTHEIGVRMALGAQAANVMRLVAWSGLRTVLVGIVAGIVIAIAAGRALATVLFGISPRDPLTLAAVSVTFALVALVASLVPAWRAARVDPVVALRDEG